MAKNFQTAADIIARLRAADADELAVLERTVRADTRKTVQGALRTARKRIDAQRDEAARLDAMYETQERIADGRVTVGLDEVGRGPLAGPLTVGAVILPLDPRIQGIHDSKQLSAEAREECAARIRLEAAAYAIVHIPPRDIDEFGMTACLKTAFSRAVREIEAQGIIPDVVLLDGNPLRFDPREVNVVKGDATCASIGAASIIAKVERDALMVRFASEYPGYGFERNKGYGSEEHQAAIREHGLTPIHRRSFCTSFLQDALF